MDVAALPTGGPRHRCDENGSTMNTGGSHSARMNSTHMNNDVAIVGFLARRKRRDAEKTRSLW
jgi:hypothetical protein